MEVYLLFVQRVEQTPGQFAPQVLGAIDAQSMESVSLLEIEHELIEDWNRRFENELRKFDALYSNTSWIKTTLNQPVAYFRDRLTLVHTVEGAVEEMAKPKGSHAAYGGITVTRGRQGGTIEDDEILG